MSEQISKQFNIDIIEQIDYDCETFKIKSRSAYVYQMARMYHEQYSNEINKQNKVIAKELKELLDDSYYGYSFKNASSSEKSKKCEAIADALQSNVTKKLKNLNNKSTKKKSILITNTQYYDINEDFDNLNEMAIRFFQLSSYEREKILFIDQTKENNILSCTNEHTTITFRLTNSNKHTVYPYKLVCGKNKIYNYLLCGEKNNEGEMYAVCYHLYKIEPNSIKVSSEQYELPAEVQSNLERMIHNGPEHSINNETITTIFLTEKGENMYNSIYHDRPPYLKKEKKENGYVYTFDCDDSHLFLYFKKFGYDALILENNNLKNMLKNFYTLAASLYTKDDK